MTVSLPVDTGEYVFKWRWWNPIQLNTSKTKEFVVVLKKCLGFSIPVIIIGIKVEIVDSNYLGIYIDNKLDWTKYTVYVDTVLNNGQSWL